MMGQSLFSGKKVILSSPLTLVCWHVKAETKDIYEELTPLCTFNVSVLASQEWMHALTKIRRHADSKYGAQKDHT